MGLKPLDTTAIQAGRRRFLGETYDSPTIFRFRNIAYCKSEICVYN